MQKYGNVLDVTLSSEPVGGWFGDRDIMYLDVSDLQREVSQHIVSHMSPLKQVLHTIWSSITFY
jgi:hypothetical protein